MCLRANKCTESNGSRNTRWILRGEVGPYIAYCLCAHAASSAEAERSFTALRRIKTCLRSTMMQTRLNYVAVCPVGLHQDLLDASDLDDRIVYKQVWESKQTVWQTIQTVWFDQGYWLNQTLSQRIAHMCYKRIWINVCANKYFQQLNRPMEYHCPV